MENSLQWKGLNFQCNDAYNTDKGHSHTPDGWITVRAAMQITLLLSTHPLPEVTVKCILTHLMILDANSVGEEKKSTYFLGIISLKENLECGSVWISCCCNVLKNLVPTKLSPWAITEQVPLNLLCWHVLAKCCGVICGDNKSTVRKTHKLQSPYVVSDSGTEKVFRKLWPWTCLEQLTSMRSLMLSKWLLPAGCHPLSHAPHAALLN